MRPKLGRPKGTGGKAEELSSAEIRRIDKCLTGIQHEKRNRALFWLDIGTGMRISELAGLLVGDVDSRGKVKTRVVLEKHSTKSGKSRTVAVSKQAAVSQVWLPPPGETGAKPAFSVSAFVHRCSIPSPRFGCHLDPATWIQDPDLDPGLARITFSWLTDPRPVPL